ncbi:hypothetical protein E4U21_006980 [Claviceps maximensis]|nr:hypothetical protein E4U21_006980 [Claviceps maximensis]
MELAKSRQLSTSRLAKPLLQPASARHPIYGLRVLGLGLLALGGHLQIPSPNSRSDEVARLAQRVFRVVADSRVLMSVRQRMNLAE